jgi:transposase-like protein
MSGVQRRIFPEAFKREAVERVRSGGLTAGKVAAELGIHETVLRRWMKQSSGALAASLPRPTAQMVPRRWPICLLRTAACAVKMIDYGWNARY